PERFASVLGLGAGDVCSQWYRDQPSQTVIPDSPRSPAAFDRELCANLGDGTFQAALCFDPSVTSMPLRKVTPAMTFGNWFSPFSRRQVFAAAMISLKTMSRAVLCDSAPLVRTVRCRTVANTLSIGFAVRRWSQCSAGKS